MDRTLLCVVILLLCFLAESHAYSAKEVYRHLNETEKKYFLQYFLAKGYMEQRKSDTMSADLKFPTDLNIPKDTVKKFETLNIDPDNFAATFFYNFTIVYGVPDIVALNWARGEMVCFPDGNCIDLGDVGTICCT